MGSYTPNLNLYKPAVGETGWGLAVNSSTDILDTDIQANVDAIALNTTHRTSDGSDHTFIDQSVVSGATPTFSADNFSDGGGNAIITTTQETNFEAAYSHVSSDGSDHTFIDQSVVSGATPTFSADNFSDGGGNAIITTTQETNFEAAYSHVSSDGSDHTFIDQSVVSGATPTFSADNFSDGGGNAIITTTQETNFETAYTHATTTHDYAYISGNDAGTDITAAQLEELSDGSSTTLHTHAGLGTDEKVKVDAAATADYIGAASNDGVLRTSSPFSYTDGGDYVTLTLDTTASVDSTGTWQFARVELDADTCYLDRDGSNNMTFTDAVTGTKTLAELTLGETAAINFIIDGGGSAITTGVKGYIEISFACTITQQTTLLEQSGSIVIDIWKDTYANYPPTVADTITAAAKPTIAAGLKDQDSTLTGWTTSVTAGDILAFNVDSITTTELCTICLRVTRT